MPDQTQKKYIESMREFIHLLLEKQALFNKKLVLEIEELEKYSLGQKEKIFSRPEIEKNILNGYVNLMELIEEDESKSKYSRERYF